MKKFVNLSPISWKDYLPLLVILLVQLFLLFQSRYTFWPEMILYPYLFNNGFKLYKDIINPYFPLLTILLSFYFKLFGLSLLNLKIFTYLVVIINQLIVYFSVRKLGGSQVRALLACFFYLILHYVYGGNGLWFELILAPFLISSLMLLFSKYKYRYLVSGVLFAFAVLIKQNAAVFIIPILLLILSRKNFKEVLIFAFPGIFLGVITFLYFLYSGILIDFVNWAIKLTLSYASQPGFVSMPAIRQYPFILFPLMSLWSVFCLKFKTTEKLFWLTSGLLATLFAFPRYEDFHLQVLVLLSSIFVVFLPKKIFVIFLICCLVLFGRGFNKLFLREDRFLDKQTIEISEKIEDYQSVYLLNSPDLAYFLGDKLPPKPWATNFPWYFEQKGFEDKFISGLKDAETEVIVIGDRLGGNKYALGNYIPERLSEYIKENYIFEERFKNFEIWRIKTAQRRSYAKR